MILKLRKYYINDFAIINNKYLNKNILLQGRIHNCKAKGKLIFVNLRDNIHSIQCVFSLNNMEKNSFNYLKGLKKESIIEVKGRLIESYSNIESATISNYEVQADNYNIISESYSHLPVQLSDLLRYNTNDNMPIVNLNNRLNHRIIDLRTEFNLILFKIKSSMLKYVRDYFFNNDFTEINTPKIIENSSEGGSELFKIKYFERDAYLAQSPQLYKQSAVISGFKKVYEIGNAYRAEKSLTNRHLCEFTMIDFEMEINNLNCVISRSFDLVYYVFEQIDINLQKEIKIINKYFNFEINKEYKTKNPIIISFDEALSILEQLGKPSNDLDLSLEQERDIGSYIKDKYGTDLFCIKYFPIATRPFYTKKKCDKYSYSFDIYFKGNEIMSGAQREHDYLKLLENINHKNIPINTLSDYLENFKYGVPKHGGSGIGIDRIISLYLNINSVKLVNLFPRSPDRLTP